MGCRLARFAAHNPQLRTQNRRTADAQLAEDPPALNPRPQNTAFALATRFG
jgi:hypothetical protein